MLIKFNLDENRTFSEWKTEFLKKRKLETNENRYCNLLSIRPLSCFYYFRYLYPYRKVNYQ